MNDDDKIFTELSKDMREIKIMTSSASKPEKVDNISQEETKERNLDIEAPLENLELEKAIRIGADIVRTEIMIEEESSENLEEEILENQEMTEMVVETEIEEEVVKTAEIETVEATKTAETETEEIEMRVKI